MKKKLLFVIGALILTVTGCGKKMIPKLQDGKEVVASIDGYDLTAEELYEKLKETQGISIVVDKIDTTIADKEIGESKDADEYAKEQIKALKAQYELYNRDFKAALSESGYKNEDELAKVIASDYKKDLVLKNYLSSKLTDEEINDYYDKEIYGEMTVKHILIKPEKKDGMTDTEVKEAENKALEKAKDLIKQIKDGADFEKLAKENSDDTGTASQGGLFTNFTKDGVVEEFFDASLKLKDGEYTKEPVKTTYGYHIILKVSQNEKPKLNDVIDDIKEKIVSKQLEDDKNLSMTAWDEIRKKYNMSINDSILNDSYNKVINTVKENS